MARNEKNEPPVAATRMRDSSVDANTEKNVAPATMNAPMNPRISACMYGSDIESLLLEHIIGVLHQFWILFRRDVDESNPFDHHRA